jgi:hypothetical protein
MASHLWASDRILDVLNRKRVDVDGAVQRFRAYQPCPGQEVLAHGCDRDDGDEINLFAHQLLHCVEIAMN